MVLTILLSGVFVSCSPAQTPPNIILIMGDDIGFSDLGCYGSEINTPNIDKLAESGIRFRTFYNAAKCETTRSNLLTGLYAGNHRALNVASLLNRAGYTTIHTGKEHFQQWVPERCYARNAFDNSLTFWATNEFHIPPDSTFERPFYLEGREVSASQIKVNSPPFFKTDVVTDYALRYLDKEKASGKPFFLYLPYHTAHYPLQAKPSDIAKYKGKYKVGWDVIRQRRYQRMLKLGIIDRSYALSPPTDNINQFRGHPPGDEERRANIPKYRPWEELSETEKDDLDLEMAVFAAMIDCMDQNIGRVLKWLKENDEYENTIVMYLSDNGSCPYDSNKDFDHPPGPADSYRTLSAAWANVGNTPFKYFKQFGHEGGGRTHFIVHWPEKIKKPTITNQIGHITDIFPTILDLAGIEYPEELDGKKTVPLHGKSLMPIINGELRENPGFIISGFSERFRMFRSDEYKIVKANNREWELYNLEEDPTELDNLAQSVPEKVQELSDSYLEIRMELDSLLSEIP